MTLIWALQAKERKGKERSLQEDCKANSQKDQDKMWSWNFFVGTTIYFARWIDFQSQKFFRFHPASEDAKAFGDNFYEFASTNADDK